MGRGLRRAACLALALVALVGAHAAVAPAIVTVAAGAAEPAPIAYSQALVPRDSVSPAQVAAGKIDSALEPASAVQPVAFTPRNELWIPLRVHNPRPTPQVWSLLVRQTSLDELALFEPAGEQWRVSLAGDRVPHSQWSEPGRFARFELRVGGNETRMVVLRVRNSLPSAVPLQAGTRAAADLWVARADFGLAFALGALALLVLASLIQAVIYRDRTYFMYGAYTLLLALALAAISGLADEHVWANDPAWADVAKSAFPLAAAGVSVWLVQALCRVRTRATLLAHMSTVLGGLVVAAAVASAALEITSVPLVGGGMALSAAAVTTLSIWTWRRGDPMGAWVLAAHAPLIATTALIVLRMAGIATFAFRPNAWVAVSMGFILVLLLVALIRRSRELLAVQVRSDTLDVIDPLTGLMSTRAFADRVRAAVLRYQRSRHDAVIMYVRLANYDRIKEVHGAAVAEQSMIRAAMKLQRVMREADCHGRIGESTMGLILETVARRDAVLERASRLVAHGLMALPGLKPEVTLVLHIASNILSENPLPAGQIGDALEAELRAMGPRARRPIRFLEPAAPAQPGALAA